MQTANKPENNNNSHEAHPSLGKAQRTRADHWKAVERWSIMLEGATQAARKKAAELADNPRWTDAAEKKSEELASILDDMNRYSAWMREACYRIEETAE